MDCLIGPEDFAVVRGDHPLKQLGDFKHISSISHKRCHHYPDSSSIARNKRYDINRKIENSEERVGSSSLSSNTLTVIVVVFVVSVVRIVPCVPHAFLPAVQRTRIGWVSSQ